MARWRASLSSSVSRGEGGQAEDPMNCSEVKVKYLKDMVRIKYQKMLSFCQHLMRYCTPLSFSLQAVGLSFSPLLLHSARAHLAKQVEEVP